MPDEIATRFTVEPIGGPARGKPGVGTHAIRYTPPTRKNDAGQTVVGLSFPCLLASEFLSNQEVVLEKVAELLNGSEIGR